MSACSSDDSGLTQGDGDSGVVPLDAFVVPDAGFIDVGTGQPPRPDAGFLDPATLHQGKQSVGGVEMYTHVRGTLTSTMPPVVFVSTGPFLGNEYLLEPMDFLLGDIDDPDRLHIYFDLRATGQSSFTSLSTVAITLDTHLADLGAVLDWTEGWLGRSTTFDIVGHGYGAGLAVLYTADRPERISRLVLVAPHPANIDQHAEWYAEWNSRLSQPERERLQEITRWDNCLRSIPLCSQQYWNTIGPHWLCEENDDLFDTMRFENIEMRPYWSRGFINQDLRAREFDWQPEIAQIRKPTTIIAGACDPIPADAAQVFNANIPGSTLYIFEDSGHFPFVESRARFQGIVKQALTY